MTQKVFPIITETACLLKWNWSTIFFSSGTSASCHRTQTYTIDPNNFGEFHNLPEKIIARETMLTGQWPDAGCQYCKNVEDSGGTSDRMFNLNNLQNEFLIPPELHRNATATSITPTILEVYFTNTCNMACVYCGPHLSSKWEDENRKFKKELSIYPEQKSQHHAHYDNMVSSLWDWLARENHYKTIQRYHVLGGEPFLQKELDDSIDFWNEHGNPDLVFSVITNLNIPHKRFKSYIKKFEKLVLSNKIWKLQLTASLDGWGSAQEYVRRGLDLGLWQENFESLLNCPWIELSINSTISPLTVKDLPGLIEKINVWNEKQIKVAGRWRAGPILHSFNTASGSFDNIYYFGPGVFDEEFKNIIRLMPINNEMQLGSVDAMRGIATTLTNSTRDLLGIEKLIQYLDELDVRRKTSWKDHFPWLNQDFSVK